MSTKVAVEKSISKANPHTCGVVMPISSMGDYPQEHWVDIRQILFAAIEEAGFVPLLVSDAEDIGIIQKRIIQNIYSNEMVICDV